MSCTPVLSRQAKTPSKACDPDWQKDIPVDEFRTAGPETMASPTSPLSERDDVTARKILLQITMIHPKKLLIGVKRLMIGVWQKASHKRAMIRMRKLRVLSSPYSICSKCAHICTQHKTCIAQK